MKIIWNEARRKTNISDESFEEIVGSPMSSLSQEDKDFVIASFNNGKYGYVVEYVYNKSIRIIQDAVFSVGEDMVVSLTHWLDRKFVSTFFDVFVLRLATEFELVSKKEEIVILEIIENLQKKHDSDEQGTAFSFTKDLAKYYVSHLCDAVLLKDFSPFTESIKSTIDSLTSFEILPYEEAYNDIIESSPKKRNLLVRMIVSLLYSDGFEPKKQKILCQNAKNLFPFLWDCVSVNDKKFFAYSIKVSGEQSLIKSVFDAVAGQIKMQDFTSDLATTGKLLKSCQEVLSFHYSVGSRREEAAALLRLSEVGSYPNLFLRSVITPCLVTYLDGICGITQDSRDVSQKIMLSITSEKWNYYFKTFFEKDDFVLMNLATKNGCIKDWCNLVRKVGVDTNELPEGNVLDIITASKKLDYDLVKLIASKMCFD